ncbi:dATP/dGTP pyrophosphohydrolase domain-containing protein [Paragemmobacter straminiformis]|nr:dATP/dGTP pyrophosphohydrolase domain-containing protein [Gemmobacter straminiformis]
MNTENRLAMLREEHAKWSEETFGKVSAIGPAKHLSKEALEFASDPTDVMELADCQMLMWDMQRRAGISDERLAQAIRIKLAVNQSRLWPEPKEGEAREHLAERAGA